MMYGPEKSDSAIVADEACEQSRATGGGVGGAKGGDRGEHGPATHATDAEPGKRVTRGWTVYGTPQGRGRRRGSPRCCTTSRSIC